MEKKIYWLHRICVCLSSVLGFTLVYASIWISLSKWWLDQFLLIMTSFNIAQSQITTETVQSSANFGAGAHQILKKFDSDCMNVAIYLEQFDSYCDVCNVPSDKKITLFIPAICLDLHNLLRDMFAPESVREKSFENITDKLKEHLKQKLSSL